MNRYMILKNGKIIGQEGLETMADVKAAISRDFRVKKQDSYSVKDFEADEDVCVDELLDQLRINATPRKEIKFPEQKPQKPIVRSAIKQKQRKPLKRTPIKQCQKPIKRSEIKRLAYDPKSPPKRKPIKPPRIGKSDIIDNSFSVWLCTQPCVITGMTAERGIGPNNTHGHHIHGRGGIRNDHMQVPLAGHIHSWGPKAYHNMGQVSFFEAWQHKIPDEYDNIKDFFEGHAKEFKTRYDILRAKLA